MKSIVFLGTAIKNATEGIVNLCNSAAQYTVRPESIIEEFRSKGYSHITNISDIKTLDLNQVDAVVGHLNAKYISLAALEGLATGMAGGLAIAADIPTLLALNLRAIGEYASYYGYDISSQQERIFALRILGVAASPSDASKSIALMQLTKISQEIARKATWKELNEHAFVVLINTIAKEVGEKITKAKLAQIIPAVGGVIGGGFNSYFTSKVCEAAFLLYRERFLLEKYGEKILN